MRDSGHGRTDRGRGELRDSGHGVLGRRILAGRTLLALLRRGLLSTTWRGVLSLVGSTVLMTVECMVLASSAIMCFCLTARHLLYINNK